METHEIAVRGRDVSANGGDTTIVRTGIGVDEIHVLFDNDEWLDFSDSLKVTFVAGDGETAITVDFDIDTLTGSDEWAAEGTVEIPWEINQILGGVSITFFATSLSGDHIVTSASGTPLSVVSEGVIAGTVPQGAPTLDAWQNLIDTTQGIITTTNAGKLTLDLEALSTALGL